MLFLGKAWRPGAPKFRTKFDHSAIAAVQKRRAVRWHGAIPCKWATAAGRLLCNDTKKPWQNPIQPRPMFPCPICAQRRPRITKSSGLCSRARQRTCQKRPARLPAFSWAPAHNGRLSAQSRATANTATGEAPDSHRVPSNPPATQCSGKGEDDTM